MTALPVNMRWTGESMQPLAGRATHEANNTFVVGQVYRLIEENERSMASHAHQFAEIAEVWKNLPDEMAERWPTAEHLRKFALIKTGFADHRQFVASSKAEAIRIATFLRPTNEYAIISVEGCVVSEWTAQSQSRKAMGADRFQESKQKILDYCANLIGVTADDVTKNHAA